MIKEEWVRPDWNKLIPEAKEEDFRCGKCAEMRPWDEQWDSTKSYVASICDKCRVTIARGSRTMAPGELEAVDWQGVEMALKCFDRSWSSMMGEVGQGHNYLENVFKIFIEFEEMKSEIEEILKLDVDDGVKLIKIRRDSL